MLSFQEQGQLFRKSPHVLSDLTGLQPPLCQGSELGSHPTALEVPWNSRSSRSPVTVTGSLQTTSLRAGSSSRAAGQSHPHPGDPWHCTDPMEPSLPTLKGPRPGASSPTGSGHPFPPSTSSHPGWACRAACQVKIGWFGCF